MAYFMGIDPCHCGEMIDRAGARRSRRGSPSRLRVGRPASRHFGRMGELRLAEAGRRVNRWHGVIVDEIVRPQRATIVSADEHSQSASHSPGRTHSLRMEGAVARLGYRAHNLDRDPRSSGRGGVQIRWYLTRPAEADVIAQRARVRCMREHRWLHRYEAMLRLFGVL